MDNLANEMNVRYFRNERKDWWSIQRFEGNLIRDPSENNAGAREVRDAHAQVWMRLS